MTNRSSYFYAGPKNPLRIIDASVVSLCLAAYDRASKASPKNKDYTQFWSYAIITP
jgi:hypothetical protein